MSVQLGGGVGNQLFQYYAGLSFALRNNCLLNLYEYKSSKAFLFHGSRIEDFRIRSSIKLLDDKPDESFFEKLQYRSQRLKKGTPYFLLSQYSHYRSPVLGFDPMLDFLKPNLTLSGYFQSYKYFESAVGSNLELGTLDLVNDPTAYYFELLSLVKDFSTAAIHVRRGDYVQISATVGLLDATYYKRALKELGSAVERILVFSDDVVAAQLLLRDVLDSRVLFVSRILPPVESLKLMSLCDMVITANSSFSYWGAMMGSKKTVVISPKKWFRGEEDPEQLSPDSWIQIPSTWQD